MKFKQAIKLISELGPLVVFFVLYKYYSINHATIGIMIATLFSTAINFYLEKKISYLPLLTCALVAVFGGITIYSGDTRYIKMKPTAINLLFFSILIGGVFVKKGLLKYVFGHTIKMSDNNWLIFSKRWALYFLFVAILNEVIWRNFSENLWVTFKVFGIMGLTVVFILSQLPFLTLHKIEE